MSLNVDIGCKRQRDEDHISAAAKRNKGLCFISLYLKYGYKEYHSHYLPLPFIVDVVVKETPIKKQVENYRRYKLQRLR